MTENDLEKILAEKFPHIKYDDFLDRKEHFPPDGWDKYSTVVATVIREATEVKDLKKKLHEDLNPGFLMFECGYAILD